MFGNYWRIALRNLVRNRFSAVINIGGLAIGMAVAILIGLWVHDELSFDGSIPNHRSIAAVLENQNLSGGIETWWGEAKQLAPALRKDYGSRFRHVVTYAGSNAQLDYGDKKLNPSGAFTDPEIIDMLSIRMLRGSPNPLQNQASIIMSAATAKSFFGDADPVGKVVLLDHTKPLKVTGVYADLPVNSSFANMTWVIPFSYYENTDSTIKKLNWGNSWFNTYVEVNDPAEIQADSRAIRDVKYQYSEGDRRFQPRLFLNPLDNWHLHSDFKNGVETGEGDIQYVRLFAIIGIFVLLLACINFMNLSTARSEKRAKEVGIRKAIGSLRSQLVRQFFIESLLVTVLGFILAIGIASVSLPFFNEIAGKTISIPWGEPAFWLTALCFILITGIIAGSYPALYLSSFRPIKVLKGTFRVGKLASMPRKALVVLQFTVSVILIIGTIVVYYQIQYVKDRPVGYSRDGLLMISMQSGDARNKFDAFRQELLQTGLVRGVAASESDPTNTWVNNMGFNWPGKDPSLQESFTTNGVTPEFGAVTGWQIKEGRDFSTDLATDSFSMIINETAATYMGLKHPIGQWITWGDAPHRYTIIGVVKDMVMQTPFEQVRPMIFWCTGNQWLNNRKVADIRVDPRVGMARTIAAIQAIYKRYDAENALQYRFADDEYAKKFSDAERVGKLASAFTLLAIFISCLGLLGLSAFVAEQRTREIGVRKVLGASILHLWGLLSKEFVWLVSLSMLIGGPIAYLSMNRWLGNYAYHASLSWWIFALTALGAIGITLATVSFQAIRAALANPVDSLRSE